MKYQNLFSGENKKNIINLLSSELAQRGVKVSPERGKRISHTSYKRHSTISRIFLYMLRKAEVTSLQRRFLLYLPKVYIGTDRLELTVQILIRCCVL